MAKRSTSSLAGIKRQLLVLKNRVSYLERALKPARDKQSREVLADRRNEAESNARRKAWQEFREKQRVENYRLVPSMLASAQIFEDKKNAFFRKRGLAPDLTDIPKVLRKQAKALAAERRRQER